MTDSSRTALRRVDDSGIPSLLIRLVLGCVFVYMGATKVGDPIAFLKTIRQYHLLPEEPGIYLNSVAIVMPWLEVICGVALLVGLRVRGATVLIVAMLAVFTPAILIRTFGIMAETGQSFLAIAFDCGCGTGVEIIWQKTLMNLGLFMLAVAGLLLRSRRFCLESVWGGNL